MSVESFWITLQHISKLCFGKLSSSQTYFPRLTFGKCQQDRLRTLYNWGKLWTHHCIDIEGRIFRGMWPFKLKTGDMKPRHSPKFPCLGVSGTAAEASINITHKEWKLKTQRSCLRPGNGTTSEERTESINIVVCCFGFLFLYRLVRDFQWEYKCMDTGRSWGRTHPEYREQKDLEERRSSCPTSSRKGYPQGSNDAGSLLSLEEQLDYCNNRTRAGWDDGYCTVLTFWTHGWR